MMNQTIQQEITQVTLSMDVSYPFHSHLIGRSGQHINRLMEQTRTRIHFPDRNRIAGQAKSNKVIVRGQMADIENVRQRIRMEVPVEFVVECRIDRVKAKGESSLIDYFSKTYGVLLRFYPKIDGVSCQVNIRGQHDRMDRLKEAIVQFCNITQTVLDSVVMKMETTFDHAWLSRELLEQIISKSGAGIRLPDLTISALDDQPKKNSIWIRGSMDAVYTASVLLNGLLPLQLVLQVPSNQMNAKKLMIAADQADILFHIEPSTPGFATVRLTSFEKNASQLYEMARMCLKSLNGMAFSPSIPSQWADFDTRNNFLPASKRYVQELAAAKASVSIPIAQNSDNIFDTSSSSPEASSTASSPPRAAVKESRIPASLSAARFDQNSFRHLTLLLETIGLSHYADLFLTNEIDLTMFTTLTDQDFVSIGIASFGARKIMLNAIQEMRFTEIDRSFKFVHVG